MNSQINISNEDIQMIEHDAREQAKVPGFFRHRSGRIGASVCGSVLLTNSAHLTRCTS